MAKHRAAASSFRRKEAPFTPDFLLGEEAGDTGTGHGALRVALVYPNSYGVGMASLGYHLVRQQMIASGLARVERYFPGPWNARSFETGTPLGGFDVLAFSIAFELDYANILDVLHRAGLPLFASQRQPRHPLILIGGVGVSVNRHPIYPFADVLVHGEAEDILEPLLAACREHGKERPALYDALAALPGVEVTAGALRTIGAYTGDLPAGIDSLIETGRMQETIRIAEPGALEASNLLAVPAVSRIVTPHAELGRRILVEIARGCPHHCTFCWVGHKCRSFHPRPAEAILSLCADASQVTGCKSVGLVSAAVAAHPEIDVICEGLLAQGFKVSFSSIRAEDMRPSMLETLVRSGQRSITLAPEAGDQRVRRLLGKNFTDEFFLNVVEQTQQAGLEELKLYFMIGLPTETDEEADRIVSFTDKVRQVVHAYGRTRGRIGSLSVNMGVFVPKPGTPLALLPSVPFATVRRRVRRVSRALGALPNVRVAPLSVDTCAAQALLSSGGLETAATVYSVWKSGGNWRAVVPRHADETA